jgi:acetyl-CoA carboxylase biotin carboxyl carrier protein
MMYAAPGMGAAPAAPAPAPGAEAPAQAAAGAGDEGLIEVRSPCVGTFFRAPRPESEPFVVEGDPVEAETTVCIVEAMKVMNEVRAEHHGTVEKFLVSNGDAVEYDQVLMLIAP